MRQAISTELKASVIHRMELSLDRIKACLEILTEEELWQRPNPASNSVGNLVLHLCGNITQYTISCLGGEVDVRERSEEFSANGGFTAAELLEKIKSVTERAIEVIQGSTKATLRENYSVQGFEYSGTAVLIHVVEHYSYHVGQIVYWTKLLHNRDLGFYANLDLEKKISRKSN
jgi:uncharacterized damage-inducible protein DinB